MRRALVVDDEPDALRLFVDILTSGGYEVRTATTGEEALSMINGYVPDVILLDIFLPGIDGFEVARRLAGRRPEDPIPVVAITALGQDGREITPASPPGICRFLFKPCRPKTLLEVVDDAIRYHH